MAQQIAAASEDARRQDRTALHQAQEILQRAAGDLRGWVDTARLASVQNWRLLQVGLAALMAGAIAGISLASIVAHVSNNQAPKLVASEDCQVNPPQAKALKPNNP
jgi:hypothetical protein